MMLYCLCGRIASNQCCQMVYTNVSSNHIFTLNMSTECSVNTTIFKLDRKKEACRLLCKMIANNLSIIAHLYFIHYCQYNSTQYLPNEKWSRPSGNTVRNTLKVCRCLNQGQLLTANQQILFKRVRLKSIITSQEHKRYCLMLTPF